MALEYLRKLLIKLLSELELIFIPVSSEADFILMDIDSGSGSDNPGTERFNSAEVMTVELMKVDVPDESIFIIRSVSVWA
ncbi:hypothetical protein EHS14_02955 [Schaalia georgiae]|nr:hypothetical protein EHS14_02955 [Schaalia georgiae]